MMVSFWSSIYQIRPTRRDLTVCNLISSFSNVNQPYIYYRGWRHGCRLLSNRTRKYGLLNKRFLVTFDLSKVTNAYT